MSGITGILNIARGALSTQKNSLEVIGHNVANVNTPGYSVQNSLLSPNLPLLMEGLMMGTGVNTLEVRRTYSQFLNDQLNDKSSAKFKWEAQKQILSILEAEISSDSSAGGINQLLGEFWNSWEELANTPDGLAQRSMLLANAAALAGAFNTTATHLAGVKDDLNAYIQGAVVEVNRHAEQLAELNEKIIAVESQNLQANDLRDQRDQLLEKVAELVPVRYLENQHGVLSVFLPGGYTLVEGTSSWQLDTRLDSDNIQRLYWDGSTDMSDRLESGKLGGWLELRDVLIPKYEETLDGLAAHLANLVNAQHREGLDLFGNNGADFFTYTPSFGALPNSGNVGDVTVGTRFYDASAGVLDAYDPNELKGDRYDIQFSDNGGTLEVAISNRSSGEVVVPPQAYVSGNFYDFEGLRVTLTDNGTAPRAGDRILLMANRGLAGNLAVDPSLAADPKRLAAAKPEGVEPFAVGDNRNALAIADLRYEMSTILARDGTLSEIYDFGLVGEVGNDASMADNQYAYSQTLCQQITSIRDSVAGVSLDEEMANMIRFQHAYTAAARLMTLADEMLETVLNTRR